MNEYLIKVTTKQSLKTVTKHIEKKFKLKDYTISNKTGYMSFNYGEDKEAVIRLTNDSDTCELPNMLIANKLNGNDAITMYEKGFEFTINDYSIELLSDY